MFGYTKKYEPTSDDGEMFAVRVPQVYKSIRKLGFAEHYHLQHSVQGLGIVIIHHKKIIGCDEAYCDRSDRCDCVDKNVVKFWNRKLVIDRVVVYRYQHVVWVGDDSRAICEQRAGVLDRHE